MTNRPRPSLRGRWGQAGALVAALLLIAACGTSDPGGTSAAAEEPIPASTTPHPPTATTSPPDATSLDLGTTVDTPDDLPGYRVYRPTDLDATDRPLPVIAWANGACLRWDGAWEPMLQRWAAAGFVVIAIAATEGAAFDHTDRSSAADQSAALDWAEEQNAIPGGPYGGRLDPVRMGVAGTSCGGLTSIKAAAEDRRVDAVFVLSGSGTRTGADAEEVDAVMTEVLVPIAYVTGGPEDVFRAQADEDYAALRDRIPAYIARRSEGNHISTATSEEVLVGEVAGIAISWFDLVFNRNAEALAALTTDPCPGCPPGTWSAESKDLDALVSP